MAEKAIVYCTDVAQKVIYMYHKDLFAVDC